MAILTALRARLQDYRLPVAAALLGASLVMAALPARADEAELPQADGAAEALFLEGRKLMAAGQLEAACQRFEASRRIEPALGTTLNLARCYLKLGRSASAWLLYRDSAASARALGQGDREALARRELATIEPELARVMIQMEPALAGDRKLTVTLDGSTLPSSLLGAALPVDPGRHRVAVRTAHAELWSAQLEATARHTESVLVPHLVLPPEPPAPAATAAATPARDRTPAPAPHWLTPRRKGALAFAGVGAVVAGYALFETFRATSANESSDPDSCKAGTTCSVAAVENRERAFASARRASIAAGVSGACLVSAGILWLLGAPPEQQPAIGSTGSAWSLAYSGTW